MLIDDKLIQGFKKQIDVRRNQMVIDEEIIQGFKNQIGVLTNLRDTVLGALGRATDQYEKVSAKGNFGKRIEDVIGADQPKQ